ncbi:hypothetical protein BG006_002244 [Podila minutissima]|uniref:FAD-binding domain-containing protein n=1 Tax=Podila minutissima TaxID=64525 RepID=A0A9P5ST02_9FUNG|nr:hypothetical protein BG006_002244 [Podila minutissima]
MSRTQILIAGAGLGGLAMAIMLERLPEDKRVDYLILERSVLASPLGSAISLHASVVPLLKQLGLWAEVERISKPMSQFTIKREDGSDLGSVDFSYGQLDYSYYGIVMSRPDLHRIFLAHVPAEKILTGKRILSTSQDDLGVSVHCSDSTIYHGDILVGADGAYSSVRQSLYKEMVLRGNLPKQDYSPIKLDQVVVVGITEPLNPLDYPMLREDVCQFRIVLGGRDRPYTMWMVPLSNNRIGWSIGGRSDAEGSSYWSLSQEEASTSFSKFPDWIEAEQDSIEEICRQCRTKPNPFGMGTYGDLIDRTPKNLISRVMFEEKGFRTWYGGRTVLIGDGVVNAVFDGACLVNLIHDLPQDPTMDNLGDMFQAYFERRYPAARIAIEGSSQFSKLFHDQEKILEDGRVVMFNSVPRWLQRWTLDRNNRTDPKLDFLSSLLSSRSSQTGGGEHEQASISLDNSKKSLLTMSILAQREEAGEHTIFDRVQLAPKESEYTESTASSDISDEKSESGSSASYSSVQEQRGRSDSVSKNSALR